MNLQKRPTLFSELAGLWRRCYSAFDRTGEMGSLQTKSFLVLLFKLAGNYATYSEKAGLKFDPNVALPARHRPPFHK
jgi:hypothetical protein